MYECNSGGVVFYFCVHFFSCADVVVVCLPLAEGDVKKT